jgi:hypothetical protein
VLGMDVRLGVEVPCGAAGGNHELKATAWPARACGEEAMKQIAASNESEVPLRLACQGERAEQCNALYPDVAGQYGERSRRDTLRPYPKRSLLVLGGGNGEVGLGGGNDTSPMPEEKSDHLVVAMKPVKVGGAKGMMS